MLAEFISDIPDSMIVAVTVRGEAGRFFSGRARRSLRKIGATRSPGINWSHAIIGLKGASPGQAIEAISSGNHVSVGTFQKGGPHFDTDEQEFEFIHNRYFSDRHFFNYRWLLLFWLPWG